MNYTDKPQHVKPRIILHGGAGNITRENLPPKSQKAYRKAMLEILNAASTRLSKANASALDVATYAVSLLEEHPLFNSGRGAVFTIEGTHELEASVMVSRGYHKRGVGVTGIHRTKSPVTLAREVLMRGEALDGGGAQTHVQLRGETCDRLAHGWGLDIVNPSYFWTRRNWDQHRELLGLSHDDATYEEAKRRADGETTSSLLFTKEVVDACQDFDNVGDIHWDGKEYLPQGTVGAVVLDSSGTLCTATSTGGLINKLPARIGDTPTIGAFWAEEWQEAERMHPITWLQSLIRSGRSLLSSDCLPGISGYTLLSKENTPRPVAKALAMSGTGFGDSFLRVNAVRTAAAMVRYSGRVSLQEAVTAVAGSYGLLQRSAGNRWRKSGEGEGGIIGIELVDGLGQVVFDFNCGMFHAWIDDDGKEQFGMFK